MHLKRVVHFTGLYAALALVACSDDEGSLFETDAGDASGDAGESPGGRSASGGRGSGGRNSAGGRAASSGGASNGGSNAGGVDAGAVDGGGTNGSVDSTDGSAEASIDAGIVVIDGGPDGSFPDATNGVSERDAMLVDVSTDHREETGDGGASAPLVCQESCKQDEDCKRGGFPLGLVCEEERCVSRCVSNEQCTDQGIINAGNTCDTDEDCVTGGLSNGVCVTMADGNDYCASTDIPPGGGCARDRVTRPRAEGGGTVDVCLRNKNTVCSRSGACVEPCAENCAEGSPQTCDETTSECICTSDDDCATVAKKPTCEIETGQCVCMGDEDCDAGEHCRAGECITGCTAAEECGEGSFDGTTVSCE